ncbi:LysR substrate-binding domain-containing protein [Paracoccus sp. TK19116]|uniref:LysR substrate-binding domain-containing protein n=1 Tax=Paracoccus albicereus TaxID=2922394 RepID=A0ABT1MQA6_9RHOB|nr:LysR substrate-binding domain-containing protein [Paracoccus albicereus]MCQ0970497.1 LysR substrate-binding domain-containing protein [Paracoccus albicereus]
MTDLPVSLRTLRYIVEVADAGSVTDAARRLGVSQPSVSVALAQAERDLGVQIFVRQHARGMNLSVPGRVLVDQARGLLRAASELADTARSLGDPLSGEIVVGSFPRLAMRYMPRIIASFRQAFPNITVRLIEGDHAELVAGLENSSIEIALGYDFARPEHLSAEELASLPPMALLSRDHPLAGSETISLSELASDPFILLDLPFSRDYFLGLFSSCGLQPSIAFRSSSPELVRGLVGNGMGFSLHNTLPLGAVAYDGSESVTVPISGDPLPVRIMLLRLATSDPRPAVQAFREFMHKVFTAGNSAY